MLKPRFLSFILLSALLYLTGVAEAHDWTRLERGLYYTSFPLPSDNQSITVARVHAFKINPTHFKIAPLFTPRKRSTIKKLAEENKALIAVNANYFDVEGEPLGLILKEGLTLNPTKNISWWGIFYLDQGLPRIAHVSEYKQRAGITNAVQAGPRLVINGEIPKLKAGSSQRTAIGIARDGNIILMTVLKPIELKALATLLSKPELQGGLGCVNALNLDGGSSSQMISLHEKLSLSLPSYVSVPVGLGVFRK